jgi:hypothetical protein
MKARRPTVSVLFVLALLTGCAATQVTQQTPLVSPGLARPKQIWVYTRLGGFHAKRLCTRSASGRH